MSGEDILFDGSDMASKDRDCFPDVPQLSFSLHSPLLVPHCDEPFPRFFLGDLGHELFLRQFRGG